MQLNTDQKGGQAEKKQGYRKYRKLKNGNSPFFQTFNSLLFPIPFSEDMSWKRKIIIQSSGVSCNAFYIREPDLASQG